MQVGYYLVGILRQLLCLYVRSKSITEFGILSYSSRNKYQSYY